ncbi:MAG: NB-ARC domain-containing protein, partial [Xenococcus sp. (in: cyanobacteria)]
MTRAKRSNKVAPNKIYKVKSALTVNGFPSQRSLATEMGMSRATISNFLNGKPVDNLNFIEISEKLNLDWQEICVTEEVEAQLSNQIQHMKRQDWGFAPEVSQFYGRELELEKLERYIIQYRYRLIELSGMGGIGKTSLAIKLGHKLQNQFDYVIWKSLVHTPSLETILDEILIFLDSRELIPLPNNINNKLSKIINLLRKYRCLIILDNADSITEIDKEHYSNTLKRIGLTKHQSCLILTSREKFQEIAILEDQQPVISLELAPLDVLSIKKIKNIGSLSGSETEWQKLIERYFGNPQMLKLVASNITDVFGGDIAKCLENSPFNGVSYLIEEHLCKLSKIETDILYWLAIYRCPVNLYQFQNDLLSSTPNGQLLNAIKSLKRKFLIEISDQATYTLQQLVMEYISDKIAEQIYKEITTLSINILNRYALVVATSECSVRNIQRSFIIKRLQEGLIHYFGSITEVRNVLKEILDIYREDKDKRNRYLASNIIHLLRKLDKKDTHSDLKKYDFSNYTIRLASLRNFRLQDANFSNTHFIDSLFLDNFSHVLSVTISSNTRLLAISDIEGKLYLWKFNRESNIKPTFFGTLKGHTKWLRTIDFSPNNKIMASGGEDTTVRLWDLENNRCLEVFEGHLDKVRKVTFSPDGNILASCSDDQTIKLWDINNKELITTLTGHEDRVRAIQFSSDGKFIISASEDNTVIIWDTQQHSVIDNFKLKEQKDYPLRGLVLSPNDNFFVTGCDDCKVRIWEKQTGKLLRTFGGHSNWIRSLAFHPEGQLLASSCEDGLICLWDIDKQECIKVLKEHRGRVWSIAISSDGEFLFSGSNDRTAKLWEVSTGNCVRTLQGYSRHIRALVFSPDSNFLAHSSSGLNETVKLWNIAEEKIINIFGQHKCIVWSIDFSSDGKFMITCGGDRTLKTWEVSTGKCLHSLSGHTNWIRSVAICRLNDMYLVASSSDDKTIRLWNIFTGECLYILKGHHNWIRSIVFSPDGQFLYSGSDDCTIKKWNPKTGKLIKTIVDGSNRVQIWSIAISPDGKVVASSGNDHFIRLWDTEKGECLKEFEGHKNWIQSVAYHPQKNIIASGSYDR